MKLSFLLVIGLLAINQASRHRVCKFFKCNNRCAEKETICIHSIKSLPDFGRCRQDLMMCMRKCTRKFDKFRNIVVEDLEKWFNSLLVYFLLSQRKREMHHNICVQIISNNEFLQRHIQCPVKHLRWSFFKNN